MCRMGVFSLVTIAVLLGVSCARKGREVAVSLIDELPNARVVRERDVHVRESRMTINGDTRRCLFMHPTSSAEFDLVIPAKAKLTFAIGIPPDVWGQPGDGVGFSVTIVQSEDEQRVVYRRYLNPKAREADRGWQEAEVDLTYYEGQRVKLVLATDPGPENNPGWDWAGWAEPTLRGQWW